MRRLYLLPLLALMVSAVGWTAWTQVTTDRGWKAVERTIGYPGQTIGDGFKVSIPRTDLNVLVHGAWLAPVGGLSSWFAFKPLDRGCLLIGELTVVDGELASVESQLAAQGLTLMALYRPWSGETPGVQRLRFWGEGKRGALAQKARILLAATGMPLKLTPPVARPAALVTWALPVEKVLGPGGWQGPLLRFDFDPNGPVTEKGYVIPSYMGLESSLYFQPDGKQAQVYGQWVVPAEKAEIVLEALLQEHIPVTSTHSDLLIESPVQVTIHFWIQGEPVLIAKKLNRVGKKAELLTKSPPAAQ